MKLSGREISERVEALRKDNHESRDDVAKLLGKNKQFFIDWRNYDRILSVEDLIILAQHYGVTMDYIATGNTTILPDDTALILSKINKLSEGQRIQLKVVLDALVEFNDGENIQ